MSAARVFLSYSPEDEAVAEAICQKLEARDIACWIASRDLSNAEAQYGEGMIAGEDVIQAIEGSEVIVLVFSASSNSSPRVRREIERAVAHNLVIVPFRLEDVPLSKSMEYFISTTHWLDALTQPLDKHLDYLVKTLEVLIADRENARHSSLIVQRRTSGPLPGMEKVSVPTPAVTAPLAPARPAWNESEVSQVEKALAAYVGPMAKMLVKEEQKTVGSIEELYQRLVRHVPQSEEKVKFLHRCEAALNVGEAKREVSSASHKPQGLFARIRGGLRHETPAEPSVMPGTRVAGATEPASASLNPESLLVVEGQLAESVGPLAKVLVKRAAQESRDLSDLYQKLSEHVPSGAERARFLSYERTKRA